MPRRVTEPRLVVASHNEGKVREIRALLAPFGIEAVSAGELDLDEPAETEETFVGNASIKAHAAAKASGLPALADDSGIEIDAIDGRPGIHTADWAETGQGRDFALAMRRAWEAVEATGKAPPHRARFVSCLVLAWPDGHAETVIGKAEGQVIWPPRGEQGFGYDPMFVPDADPAGRTFGEMPYDEKEPISHRTDAFRKLVALCFGEAP